MKNKIARIYANLIQSGLKTLDSVPSSLRQIVEQILTKDGFPTSQSV